ncbi:MAG TPA: hypothetical protein VJ508_16790, partial [Saprospiraceae bacterium]|nr:hypothetical protein [Saprospiraceae bacterium]
MKYPFCLLLICSCFLLHAQNDHDPLIDDIICHEQEKATMLMEAEHYRNYAADQTDMVYQEMHWEVDPAVIHIKGLITYHFKSRVNQLTSLVLDLANTMQVHYVKRGDTDLAFVHSNDKLLTIDLGKTLSIGEYDSLTISYEGTPLSTGLGSFLQTMHNGHPLIETESVPYGVRDWWPGK